MIAIGDQLAAEVRRLSAGIDQIDADIRKDLDSATDELNDKLAKVFEFNLRIKASDPNGAERLELIDQRDPIVRELANLVDVRSVERENGAIAPVHAGRPVAARRRAGAVPTSTARNVISVDSGQLGQQPAARRQDQGAARTCAMTAPRPASRPAPIRPRK